MKTLVIGSTGIIGNHVIRALLKEGHEVRAFARGVTPALNLEGLAVEKFQGDATDSATLERAFKGIDWVFHTAPYYPAHMFDTEGHIKKALVGVEAILKALANSSVSRLVFTSSLTTIGPAKLGQKWADETCAYSLSGKSPHPYFEVKFQMEEKILQAARAGAPCVIVNPTGCFGPYELKPKSNCLVPQLLSRKVPGIINRPINVVDVADVGRGQVLAAIKGKVGERYILGGHNVWSTEIIRRICELGKVPPPPLTLPMFLALGVAKASEYLGRALHKNPAIPLLGLKFLEYGQFLNSSKAIQELGYQISPMEPCLEAAIAWFKQIGYVSL